MRIQFQSSEIMCMPAGGNCKLSLWPQIKLSSSLVPTHLRQISDFSPETSLPPL